MRHLRIGDAPQAILGLFDLGEAIVGLQRIAASGDEIERVVEILARQIGIRLGRTDFLIEGIGLKRFGTGHAENMLAQHIQTADAPRWRILFAGLGGIDGGAAFEHFEAIGWHQQRARRLVEAMIGAADALRDAARALRRANIDDEVDIAPVDAKIERRRADHGFELPRRHRRLDLAALARIERAVMQSDGEIVVVDRPQLLEDRLGLGACVDEDESHSRCLDGGVDFAHRMQSAVARPGQALARVEHLDIGLRTGRCRHQACQRIGTVLIDEIAPQFVGIAHRGREAHGRHRRSDGA